MLSELPVRKARPQARRHEHRKPRRSFMPTSRVADDLMSGLLDDVPAQSREREAQLSESPALERSGMMAGFGATRVRAARAIRDSKPRSPVPGSQTNLVFSVRPACL